MLQSNNLAYQLLLEEPEEGEVGESSPLPEEVMWDEVKMSAESVYKIGIGFLRALARFEEANTSFFILSML